VLNKGVGGTRESWGWNPRNEYIRVYDPRDFEFEISVANMLYILQECTSTKGKGLEGEFVYSWQGTELVLLPVGTYEYESSVAFTANKSKKVTKADILPGCLYEDKDMNTLMYVGRELCRDDLNFGYYTEEYEAILTEHLTQPKVKKHIFWNIKSENFELHRGFTRLAQRISTEPDPSLVTIHANYMQSNYCCHMVGLQFSELGTATQILTPKDPYETQRTSYDRYHHYHNSRSMFFVLYEGDMYAAKFKDAYAGRSYHYQRTDFNESHGTLFLTKKVPFPTNLTTQDEITQWLQKLDSAFSCEPTHTMLSNKIDTLNLYGIEVIYNNSFKQWYKKYVYKHQ
jgi:hypothetical protein